MHEPRESTSSKKPEIRCYPSMTKIVRGPRFREEVKSQVVELVNELLDKKLALLERNQLEMGDKLLEIDGRLQSIDRRLSKMEEDSLRSKSRL